MSLIEAWAQWKAWFASLSPEFAFLLALPFLVAAAAFLRHGVRRRDRAKAGSARAPGAARDSSRLAA